MATALRFLEPMRAPCPARPALWNWSVLRQAQGTRFSPAGPIDSTLASLSRSARSAASTSDTFMPQYLSLAGRNFDVPVLDPQHHRLGGLPRDDDEVVPGELHLRGERAAHVAVVEDARRRALGAHDQPRAGAHVGAGERTGHQEDGVVRRPRVDLRRHVLPHIADEQTFAAHVLLGPLHVERLDHGLHGRQVDCAAPLPCRNPSPLPLIRDIVVSRTG